MFDIKHGHHLIWTNHALNLDDWADLLKEDYPDVTDEGDKWNIICDRNLEYLDDERMNLNINLGMPIICIADLGLWDGRKDGYKIIGSGNISDCLYDSCDYDTWYVDEVGDLCCDAIHHDGTNHYLYRVFRDGTTPEQMSKLEQKIYNGTAKWPDIARVTTKIGPTIAKVYGWYRNRK